MKQNLLLTRELSLKRVIDGFFYKSTTVFNKYVIYSLDCCKSSSSEFF